MKKTTCILIFSVMVLANFPHLLLAGPGDSVVEAFTAHLGEQNGTLDTSDDIDYYSFTGLQYQYYNFTLVPDGTNLNYINIYNNQFDLIATNATGFGPQTLLITGYEIYIIRIVATEFMETFPGNYSLFITGISSSVVMGVSQIAKIGSFNDILDFSDDKNWYNFTGSADHEYNFEVIHAESEVSLYIYNSDLILLDFNVIYGTVNSIAYTGIDKYIIAVAASEFMVFPFNYTLTITDNTPTHPTTSPSTIVSERSSISTVTETVTETTTLTTGATESITLNWFSIAFGVVLVSLIKRRSRIDSEKY